MNDYSRGIADAFCWFLRLLGRVKSIEEARVKVESTFQRLNIAAAAELNDRMSVLPED